MKSLLIISIIAIGLSLLFLTGCQCSASKNTMASSNTVSSWEMTPAGVYVPVYQASP